ncbi:hypothetical protein [Paraburkholderia sp. BL6669N2]|uniref:hypothetical protein n=1 Tax=Paraburkholderia sp. BL6669N2 TaxID=1938807 RepID=UPI0011C03199|nr:hypothetical protein [Paraburkholderia sp. BL6669N2]
MFTGIVLEVKRVFNRAINPEARKARPPAWQSETRHPAAGSAACRRRTKAVHLHYCHVRSARLLFATHSKTTRPIHGPYSHEMERYDKNVNQIQIISYVSRQPCQQARKSQP